VKQLEKNRKFINQDDNIKCTMYCESVGDFERAEKIISMSVQGNERSSIKKICSINSLFVIKNRKGFDEIFSTKIL